MLGYMIDSAFPIANSGKTMLKVTLSWKAASDGHITRVIVLIGDVLVPMIIIEMFFETILPKPDTVSISASLFTTCPEFLRVMGLLMFIPSSLF